MKFIGLPREYQLNFIETYRNFENKLGVLSKHMKLNQQPQDMLRDIVVGLFNEDFSVLRHPHDELQGHVESWIRERTGAALSTDNFLDVKDRVGIQKGKTTKDKLTYAEWLLLSIYCSEHELIDSGLLVDLRQLLEKTTHVRNAIKHDEWSKLSTNLFLTALSSYFSFLLHVYQKPNTRK